MAKIINLRAPETMRLHDMSQQDIEEYVRTTATQALDALPEELRPVGVNAVAIDSLRPRIGADPGLWAQWTRACCALQARIEDFEPPVLEDFAAPGTAVHRDVARTHVESQLRTAVLEYPEMHGGGGQ
ncbi:hypothetical protein [Kitasatospora sp. NPDC059571]|uniref:hypothetical protein n=1 Tax=Kitasatospora sp. NPDC059571 TaxID=3346871 RepID=UPI0036947DCA